MNIANLVLEVVFPVTASAFAAGHFARRSRREGASGSAWIAAISLHFIATAMSLLFALHTLQCLGLRILGKSYVPVEANHAVVFGVAWDFRIYSLLLFGLLLGYLSARCVWCSMGVALGVPAARVWVTRHLFLILGLIIPLVPLQPAAAVMAVCLFPLLMLIHLGRPAEAPARVRRAAARQPVER